MLRRTRKLLLLFLVFLLPTAGCWDAIDINDRNIVTAAVVDKTDNSIAFIVEIPKVSGSQGGQGGSKVQPFIMRGEGRDYVEAREDVDRMMDKPIFLGAVQSVILTDRLARYDIEEYVLRLRQINEYRKTVHVVVTTTEPEELLNDVPENAETVGFAIDSTLMSLVKTGQMQHVSLMDVLESLAAPYKHFVLPTIALIHNEPTYTGLSVFSGGMKTGFIPVADTKSITLMQAPNAKLQYDVPFNETHATVEVTVRKKKIVPHYQDGAISFDVALQIKAILLYPESIKPIPDVDMRKIEATLKAMLEKEFVETYQKSQSEYHYDCFRLNTPFRIAYPEQYKRMNWAEEYEHAALNLSIDVKLRSTDAIDYKDPK